MARILLVPNPAGKPPVLDWDLFRELIEIADHIEAASGNLRAAVLTSNSPRHFMVGANIQVLAELTQQTIGDWVRAGHEAIHRIEALPMPVIARVEGNALGGGLELALAADIILAGPGARFGSAEVGLGVVTGHGGAWRLARRIGFGQARHMLYTGSIVDGTTAHQMGLCDMHGTGTEVDAWIQQFLDAIRPNSAAAIAETKAMLLRFDEDMREQSCKEESASSERLIESDDTRNRIQSFLDSRRQPD